MIRNYRRIYKDKKVIFIFYFLFSNMDNENIRYLDVRQALADLAHFIEQMRATIPGATNAKVILAGGSYSATMVTWFKELYPKLATGAWASSAPLFAKVNFFGE